MSYGINSYQRKNRQKARARLLGKIAFVAAVFGVAGFSYHFGEQQMAARVNQRMDEVETLTQARDDLHKQVIDLQAAALVNQQTITEMDARYRRAIPDATVEGLVSLLREKIAAGVTTERLNTILSAAANPRHCRNRESKRFMLSTPINQGTDNAATFGSGAVTVNGDGQTATTADNRPEAWFDPLKPVSMKFRLIGGHVTVAEGKLPLQHAIIDDETEYRFTIEAGQRGFVTVTADQCDYPGAVPPPPPAAAPTPSPVEE